MEDKEDVQVPDSNRDTQELYSITDSISECDMSFSSFSHHDMSESGDMSESDPLLLEITIQDLERRMSSIEANQQRIFEKLHTFEQWMTYPSAWQSPWYSYQSSPVTYPPQQLPPSGWNPNSTTPTLSPHSGLK